MSDSIRDRLAAEAAAAEQGQGFAQADVRSGGHVPGPPSGPTETAPKEPSPAAEKLVAALFLLAVVGAVGFIAVYAAWPFEYGEKNYEWYTPMLGLTLTLSLVGIGAGAVVWAKTLMVDEETVQERHHLGSEPADRTEAAEILKAGAADAGLGRFPLLRRTFLLSQLALVAPLALVFSMGEFRHKERAMERTGWKKGSRLLDELGRPVKLGDLDVGGAKTVFPDVPGGRRMADSASLIIRMRPEQLKPMEGRENWVVDGHVVYSVICTHLGCPVKLYEQQTHHLFCPCHQSTFDAADGAKVLFGPAARNLPQLAITVDDEGYFVALGDYNEPVGPSYWERKPHYKEPKYENGLES